MKKVILLVLIIQLFLVLASQGLSATTYCDSLAIGKDERGNPIWDKPENYGCPIGEPYNGIQAKSNGPSGHWTGTGGGDLKYQCVQLAKDYFWVNYGITINTVVYAKNIFTGTYEDKDGTHKVTTDGGEIYRYENGSNLPPENGDLAVYGGTTYGHVGILKDINVQWNADKTGTGTAQVFEQNISATNPFRDITFTVDKDGGYHLPDYGVLKVLGWVSPHLQAEKAKLSKKALLALCPTGFKPSNGYQLDPSAVLVLGDSGWHPFMRYEALKAYLARTWRSEDEIQHLTQEQMAGKNSQSAWELDVDDFIIPGVACKYPAGYPGYEGSAVFFFGTDSQWHPLQDEATMQAFGITDSDLIYPDKTVLAYYPMDSVYNQIDATVCYYVVSLPDGIGGGASKEPTPIPGTPASPDPGQPGSFTLVGFGSLDNVHSITQGLEYIPGDKRIVTARQASLTGVDPETQFLCLNTARDYEGRLTAHRVYEVNTKVLPAKIGQTYQAQVNLAVTYGSYPPQAVQVLVKKAGDLLGPALPDEVGGQVIFTLPSNAKPGQVYSLKSAPFSLHQNIIGAGPHSQFQGVAEIKADSPTAFLYVSPIFLEWLTPEARQAYIDSLAQTEAETRLKAGQEQQQLEEKYVFISNSEEPEWQGLGCVKGLMITSYKIFEGQGAVGFCVNTEDRYHDTSKAGAFIWLEGPLDLSTYQGQGIFTLQLYQPDNGSSKVNQIKLIWGENWDNFWQTSTSTNSYTKLWLKKEFPWSGASKVGEPKASNIKLIAIEVSDFSFHGQYCGLAFDDIRFEKPEKINHPPEFIDFPGDQAAYIGDSIEATIKGKDLDGDPLTLSLDPDFPLPGAKIELLESSDISVWRFTYSSDPSDKRERLIKVSLLLDDGQP